MSHKHIKYFRIKMHSRSLLRNKISGNFIPMASILPASGKRLLNMYSIQMCEIILSNDLWWSPLTQRNDKQYA